MVMMVYSIKDSKSQWEPNGICDVARVSKSTPKTHTQAHKTQRSLFAFSDETLRLVKGRAERNGGGASPFSPPGFLSVNRHRHSPANLPHHPERQIGGEMDE